MKIIVVSAPTNWGFFPVEVMEAWVGVQLPVEAVVPIMNRNSVTRYYYRVRCEDAFPALQAWVPEAYDWWKACHELIVETGYLYFDIEDCQEKK